MNKYELSSTEAQKEWMSILLSDLFLLISSVVFVIFGYVLFTMNHFSDWFHLVYVILIICLSTLLMFTIIVLIRDYYIGQSLRKLTILKIPYSTSEALKLYRYILESNTFSYQFNSESINNVDKYTPRFFRRVVGSINVFEKEGVIIIIKGLRRERIQYSIIAIDDMDLTIVQRDKLLPFLLNPTPEILDANLQ